MYTGNTTNQTFPSQKKSLREKTEKWMKQCIDGAENLALWDRGALRKSYENKRINYNLYSDILDQSDVEKICNPMGVLGLNAPAKMQNYPICNPKIDLLVGESIKRKFDYRVRVMNQDAISSKEDEMKEEFAKMINGHIMKMYQSEDPNDPQVQRAIKEEVGKYAHWLKYEYQELRERTATQILKYLYTHLRLPYKFSKGFKNALICAEEMYLCDIVGGEPVVEVLNPLNVHVVRSGESPFVEDADIIVLTSYKSPGQIQDEYFDYLTDRQMSYIESGMQNSEGSGNFNTPGHKPDLPLKLEGSVDIASLASGFQYGSMFDDAGNIRVVKVFWKSRRKMKRVKYFDEFGDEQEDLFDEHYPVNKELGETYTTEWINEWWEGTKIGGTNVGNGLDDSAIYVKMQVRPVQFRRMENPSKCHPGIVGTIYNTNDNEAISLMDRMKPYQYLYNVLAYNAELMIAKNKGKIMRLNISEIPEGWEMDKWLSFAYGMNAAVVDPFKEGNKGAAQGKLAGTMNQNAPVIDMEMGNTIQLYMNTMQYIKQEMGEIAGVSQARQGQIQSREAVGNVEREVTQSSHITEYWFLEHDYCKLRLLECLLQTAKVAWSDRSNKKIPYVLDDASSIIIDVDSAMFNETEYGLQIVNSQATFELLSHIKQLTHAAMQNQMITFSEVLDIFSTDSISSMTRKLKTSEEERMNRENEKIRADQENLEKTLQAKQQEIEETREFDLHKQDKEHAHEITLKQMDIQAKGLEVEDTSNEEDNTVDLEKLKQQALKIQRDYEIKKKQHEETVRHNKVTEGQKSKEITIKRKQANKPTTTSK